MLAIGFFKSVKGETTPHSEKFVLFEAEEIPWVKDGT